MDRLCFAADMIITRQGVLKSASFYPAVMRSAARLTYTIANEALFEGRPAARDLARAVAGSTAGAGRRLSRALQGARKRGALEFDAAEAEFVIDNAERVRAIELRVRNEAHKLIEECMILANVAVAQELESTQTPTLLPRARHAGRDKAGSPHRALASLNIDARLPQEVTTRDLQAITERLGDTADRPFIESLIVRAMPQAVYQPANIGHFGLALTQYAHFTSPDPPLSGPRRASNAEGADRQTASGAAVRYDVRSSRRWARARRSWRSARTRQTATCPLSSSAPTCASASGRRSSGLITTVVEFGCFVQILDVGVDGLLHIDNLRDDDYAVAR